MTIHPMKFAIRIIIDVLLLTLAILAPWWFYVLVAFAAMVYLPDLYEAVATSFVADILYGASGANALHVPLALTTVTIVALFAIRWTKGRVRHSW